MDKVNPRKYLFVSEIGLIHDLAWRCRRKATR
jgi:hypothetical protein